MFFDLRPTVTNHVLPQVFSTMNANIIITAFIQNISDFSNTFYVQV